MCSLAGIAGALASARFNGGLQITALIKVSLGIISQSVEWTRKSADVAEKPRSTSELVSKFKPQNVT